jgi:hypothetical protein
MILKKTSHCKMAAIIRQCVWNFCIKVGTVTAESHEMITSALGEETHSHAGTLLQ